MKKITLLLLTALLFSCQKEDDWIMKPEYAFAGGESISGIEYRKDNTRRIIFQMQIINMTDSAFDNFKCTGVLSVKVRDEPLREYPFLIKLSRDVTDQKKMQPGDTVTVLAITQPLPAVEIRGIPEDVNIILDPIVTHYGQRWGRPFVLARKNRWNDWVTEEKSKS